MRLVFVTQWFPPEPAGVPLALASVIKENCTSLTVMTGLPNYPSGKLHEGYRVWSSRKGAEYGFDLVRVPLFPSHSGFALGRILNYLSFAVSSLIWSVRVFRGADGIIVYGSPVTAALPAMFGRFVARKPFVILVEDLWPESLLDSGMVAGRLKQGILASPSRWFSDRVYRKAERVIAISDGMAAELQGRGVESGRIAVLKNWAPREFEAPLERNNSLRDRLGVSRKEIVLLYSGNFGVTHNLESWIVAMSALPAELAVRLVFMGGGVVRDRLIELRDQLGVERVHFLDPVDDDLYVNYLGDADAVVLSLADRPGLATAMPSKIPNALAAGKIILASAIGDSAATIEKAGGIVVAPDGSEKIGQMIKNFVQLSDDDIKRRETKAFTYYEETMSHRLGVDVLSAQIALAFTPETGFDSMK